MLTLPSAFATDMAAGVLTLATGIKVTRADGTVLSYTDHDRDCTVGGVVYKTTGAYTASNVEDASDLSTANGQLTALLTDVDEADIEAGLYDDAQFEMFLFNYENPDAWQRTLLEGTLGAIRLEDGRYIAELANLVQRLQQVTGEVTSPNCRNEFGDARCKYDVNSLLVDGSVGTVVDRRTFQDPTRTEAAGYFGPYDSGESGIVVFTSGAANGYLMEVASYEADGTFTLKRPLPKDFAAGDSYQARPGCDKTRDGTVGCLHYDNVVNMRAEPDMPGIDEILKYGGQ